MAPVWPAEEYLGGARDHQLGRTCAVPSPALRHLGSAHRAERDRGSQGNPRRLSATYHPRGHKPVAKLIGSFPHGGRGGLAPVSDRGWAHSGGNERAGEPVPHIFDNIDLRLLPSLRDALSVSHHADFCVGYFNLRGWRTIGDLIDDYEGGEGGCCRLLVGMTRLPEDELKQLLTLTGDDGAIDNFRALQLRNQAAEAFRR